jgi:beta-lactamase class A
MRSTAQKYGSIPTVLRRLQRQTVNDRIPAGLPPGLRVAHKTGEITAIRHDAAIVFAAQPFVLVILARGASSPEAGSAFIAAITRQLYHATQ